MAVVKREKLYTMVWQRPMGHLSRQYGVSAARMREACEALCVPIPPVGHWAAVRAGRIQTAPPLQDHDGPATFVLRTEPKESLADWVLRTSPPPQVQAPPRPAKSSAASAAGAPRYVPLNVWAEQVFGEHAPHYNTLLRWVHDGRIQPQARKIGRKWWVAPSAEYVGD